MIRVKKENHRSWFMSNYYPCEFVMNGIRYKNAEAAFQSHKVPLEERRQFADMPPASAKRFGRNVAIPANWDEARDDVMRRVALPLAGCEDAISTVTSTTMSELEDIPNQILATPESAEMKPEYNYIHFRYDNIWTVSALVNYEIVDNGQNIKFEINDSRYRDKVFYTSMSNVELVYRDDSVDYGTDYTICPGNASKFGKGGK